MATASSEQRLVCGLVRDGVRHRRAVLRPLSLDDCLDVLEAGRDRLPAERTSAVLDRALSAIGMLEPVERRDVRALSVGDRDLLVLAVRRMRYGDRLECVFGCDCGEQLQLTLDLQLVLDAEVAAPPAELTETIDGKPLRLRALRGADHERVSQLALEDRQAARSALVIGCIVEDDGGGGVGLTTTGLHRLETRLAQLDPCAELELQGSCPECESTVTTVLDPIVHLWSELELERDRTEHEVHVLALAYHWSERDILALGPDRRARYLALLDAEAAAA